MSQSKRQSMIEQVLNVGTGWIISLFIWSFLISPLYKIDTSVFENIGITLTFTIASIIRGYIWRRIFNSREKQKI